MCVDFAVYRFLDCSDLSLLGDHVINIFVNAHQFSYSFFDSSSRIKSIVFSFIFRLMN